MSAKLKLPTKIPKMSKTNACRNKQKDKEKLEVFFKEKERKNLPSNPSN